MKTYLITGVNGYIGKDLALNLLREDNIVIGVGRLETPKLHVSNKNFIYLNLDLTDLDFISQIDKFEFNGVFHLASQQPSNKNITYDDFYRSNVLTTIILSNYFNKIIKKLHSLLLNTANRVIVFFLYIKAKL